MNIPLAALALAWYILQAFYGTDGAPDICRQVWVVGGYEQWW